MREALECEHVSARLHEWLDLVFGAKQRGEQLPRSCCTGPAHRTLSAAAQRCPRSAAHTMPLPTRLPLPTPPPDNAAAGQPPGQLFATAHGDRVLLSGGYCDGSLRWAGRTEGLPGDASTCQGQGLAAPLPQPAAHPAAAPPAAGCTAPTTAACCRAWPSTKTLSLVWPPVVVGDSAADNEGGRQAV